MFNTIQETTNDHFFTYWGSMTYLSGGTSDYNTNIQDYNMSYFYSFEALKGISLDCSNISILIGGSPLKSWDI
jgi:hypothetical protein